MAGVDYPKAATRHSATTTSSGYGKEGYGKKRLWREGHDDKRGGEQNQARGYDSRHYRISPGSAR